MLSTYMLYSNQLLDYQLNRVWDGHILISSEKYPSKYIWYKFTIDLLFCVSLKTEKTLNSWIIFLLHKTHWKYNLINNLSLIGCQTFFEVHYFMGNLTKFQRKSKYDILYNKSKMYTWVHAFNLLTLLSSFQSQIRKGLVHF